MVLRMLRLSAGRAGRTAAAVAAASAAGRRAQATRGLAAASAASAASTVPALLAAAVKANPLKDAAKFYGSDLRAEDLAALPEDSGLPLKGVKLWTYRDLQSHVGALSAGLHEAGFAAGDKVVACLPPGSPEYVVLLLAAAESGITVVAVDPPNNIAAVDVEPIQAALTKYKPRAIFVWHGYHTASAVSQGEGSLVSALFPTAAEEDSRGMAGFVPASGVPASSPDHPALEFIVHTGSAHVRGAIAFKSLLVYNEDAPKSIGSASSTVFVEANTGREVTQKSLVNDAKSVGARLGLVSDPYEKNGKLIVRPESSSQAAAATLSALMHGTLLISPGMFADNDSLTSVIEGENALLA